jgi:hypothetical protein
VGRGSKFIVQLPLAEPATNDSLPLLALPSAE